MTSQLGCTWSPTEEFDGALLARIPYAAPPQYCHDCEVPDGALHHPGCDMEVCAACGGQCITCGCH
jgi:hypothetical protein